ncbi:ATP-binding protein [Azospirillum sp. SYSU D00513]|uniref:sensor histidine kinase n=1 Tax=Azospirillum sp. SYSU D00513 TaxID=2812561 RepID=UPI001FFE9D5C|nr:ATP-binding protein [Azospirillum sp. SYSU D00513]
MLTFGLLWKAAFEASTLFHLAPHVSAWYPAAGVAFAFVFTFGWRILPVWFLVVVANADTNDVVWTLAQAARQVIAFGGGALLLRHLLGTRQYALTFRRSLFGVTTMVGAALLSAIAASCLYLWKGMIQENQAVEMMLGFWIGDATGVLVAAPFFIVALRAAQQRSLVQAPGWELPSLRLFLGMSVGTIAFTALVLTISAEVSSSAAPEFLLLIPIALIVTISGNRGAIVMLPIVNAAPPLLVQWIGSETPPIELQSLLLTNAVIGLLLGAVVSDRRALLYRVLAHEADLAEAVRQKTKHLEEEITKRELAQQVKARFLATVSHDCRQPLQALNLMLATLDRGIRTSEELRYIKDIQRTISSLAEFFRDLMDLSQMESGTLVARPKPVDIGGMLERLRPDIEALAEPKGFAVKVVDCSVIVRADPTLLERALRNLLGNALRYTQSGGILVGCRRRGDCLRVDVIDTGPGIPDAMRNAIFEEFFRATELHHQEGRGIGLTLVRNIADLLDGEVEVASTVGKGSRFSLYLPVYQEKDGREIRYDRLE